MAAVISLRPNDDRGNKILDRMEEETAVRPTQVIDDGTRRYDLESTNDLDAFDPMLDKIDPNWREHITNWTPRN